MCVYLCVCVDTPLIALTELCAHLSAVFCGGLHGTFPTVLFGTYTQTHTHTHTHALLLLILSLYTLSIKDVRHDPENNAGPQRQV